MACSRSGRLHPPSLHDPHLLDELGRLTRLAARVAGASCAFLHFVGLPGPLLAHGTIPAAFDATRWNLDAAARQVGVHVVAASTAAFVACAPLGSTTAAGALVVADACPRTLGAADADALADVAALVTNALERHAHRHEAEAALRASERRYRDFFERANAPVLIIDPERETILEANPEACLTYGFTREELIERSLKTLTVDVKRGEAELRTILARGGDRSFESLHYRRDGSTFHVLFNCSLFEFEGRPAVLCFGQDITALKHYEEELVVSKMQAEEMARVKDALLSNMSHEIRTPLTGILGFADVLAEEVDDGAAEFVDLIRQSGRRLMETLNSVLDLAQLESGAFEMALRPVHPAAEAAETVRLLQPLAHERNLLLRFEASGEPARAMLDATAFNRVLTNLVSNAIKFTPSGSVTVALKTDARFVRVQVRDTGVGIAAEFLPHLFDAFRQESGGLARDYEGNGLGLAIVKRLVELMGGDIDVSSEKGTGTVFSVRFPRLDAEAAVEMHRPPAAATGRRHLLVVDDNVQTQRLLACLLGERYEVDVAGSYDAALALADAAAHDVVLLDINLGRGRSGFDVLRALRTRPALARVPILACTAFARPGDLQRYLEAGFDGYVGKPFTRELVNQVLDAFARTCRRPDASVAPPASL